MDQSSLNEELGKMEQAARVLLAQNVDATQRREAESYFIRLKESNISPQICQTLLETTADPFVIFQLSQSFALSLARNYNSYSDQDVQGACKYLLELPIKKQDLPSYAIVEIFKAAAIIYKRGKKCSSEMILEIVTNLLQNSSENIQALGLRIIEALCLEHANFWRNVITTSYQQHQVAKKRFEDELLKNFLELAITCSSNFIQNNNTTTATLERFLCIAQIVFQWNFRSTIASSQFAVSLYSVGTDVILHPPQTWSDIFRDQQFLPFFFRLHQIVRHDPRLSEHSMACIVQLANLSSVVLNKSINRDSHSNRPYNLYMQQFCTLFMETFKTCLPHELLQFSNALHNFFSHHSMQVFKRFAEQLISEFIKFIVNWACQLAQSAMNQDKDADEYSLVETFSKIFSTWNILLKRFCLTAQIPIQNLIFEQNIVIIESFVKAVLAPPFGQRTNVQSEEESCEENEDLEDHKFYGSIIRDMGVFCRVSIAPFINFVINAFHDRITQRHLIASGEITADQRYLWFEDIHWLLLLTGSFFNDIDADIGPYLDTAYKKNEYQRTNMHQFFLQCIQQTETFNSPQNADPIVIISGMVAYWSGILLHSLETQGNNSSFISPEICQSTMRTLASIIGFLTNLNENSRISLFDETTENTIEVLPSLSVEGEEAAQLTNFIIRFCFAIFQYFPSDKKLCDTAVCFLVLESEKRAKFIAQSPLLYEKLSTITLERLPCRRDFMSCLVMVGSNLTTSQERFQMNDMILQPLANRFLTGAQEFQAGNHHLAPHLVDLLECFSGIAKGAQIDSGNILYSYLLPILHASIHLMSLSSEDRSLTCAILDLYKDVSKTLLTFVDFNSTQGQDNFFNLVNLLIETYKSSQMSRFQTANFLSEVEEEEQISDLILLLRTVSNSISKTHIMYAVSAGGDSTDQFESLLCRKTLEMILSLLNEDILRLPTLSNVFFRLLLNIACSSPEVFMILENGLIERLLKCFRWALDGASGVAPIKHSLETIQIISQTLCASTETQQGPFASVFFNALVGKLFELAVNSSTELETEVQVHAIKSLYAIIRLNQEGFQEYIIRLFSLPENAGNYDALVEQYKLLLPEDKELLSNHRTFREFTERFEKFACNVDPLLVVNIIPTV